MSIDGVNGLSSAGVIKTTSSNLKVQNTKELDNAKALNSTSEDANVDTSKLSESKKEEKSSGGFWSAIGGFFKSIGKAIGNFFKSIFGKKSDEVEEVNSNSTPKVDDTQKTTTDSGNVDKPTNVKDYYDSKLGFVTEVYNENGELVTKSYEKYGQQYEETYSNGLLTKKISGNITNTYEYDSSGNLVKEVYVDAGEYNGAEGGRKHHITQIETYYEGGHWPNGTPKTERSTVQYLEGDVSTSYRVYAEELDEFGNKQATEFEHKENGKITSKGTSTIADENGYFTTTFEYLDGEKCNPPKVVQGNIWSD